jgi:hypothetical protein
MRAEAGIRGGLYAVPMTAQQIDSTKGIFTGGVCDWSKAGNVTGVVPNGSFGPSPENLVYDPVTM